MNELINRNIMQMAIDVEGKDFQYNLAIEECGELITSIAQWFRGRKPLEKVAEEVADVIIMTDQLRAMIGPDLVDKIITAKMERLQVRLDNHQGKSQ